MAFESATFSSQLLLVAARPLGGSEVWFVVAAAAVKSMKYQLMLLASPSAIGLAAFFIVAAAEFDLQRSESEILFDRIEI